jgi:hypothetical protein
MQAIGPTGRKDWIRLTPALPHEKSAFVLFATSIVSKYVPPLYQDHFFSHVALHNKRKVLSCVDFGRFFMRQLMALLSLLSLWQNSSASDLSWEAHVGENVNLQSRRALLKQFAPQYGEASYAQKRVLLDVFAQATGYHRRYGMWLLNHAEDVLHPSAYKRSNQYGPEVQHALFLVWHAANRICAKRLIPFLPILIDALERHDYLYISVQVEYMLHMERGDVCTVSTLSMGSHTGTHMDGPFHFIAEGLGLHEMPLDAAIGRARVI